MKNEKYLSIEAQRDKLDKLIIDNNQQWYDSFMSQNFPEYQKAKADKLILENNQKWYDSFMHEHFPEYKTVKMEETERAIKQRVESVEEAILENNKAWYTCFIAANFTKVDSDSLAVPVPDNAGNDAKKAVGKKTKPRRLRQKLSHVWVGISSAAAMLAIVLGLYLGWQLLSPEKPDYNRPTDRVAVASDLTELNSYLGQRLNIVFDDEAHVSVTRVYNSRHRQNLFFIINFISVNPAAHGTVFIYTHRHFAPRARHFFNPVTSTVSCFLVTHEGVPVYNYDYSLYLLTYLAGFKHNGISIYLEDYVQPSLTSDSDLYDFIIQTFVPA